MSTHLKGKAWEMDVAKVTRLALDKAAKRNKSSHRGVRRSDIYTELPLHIEAKDQDNINIKAWFRQADQASSFGKAPIVVYKQDEEMMVALRYSDLLNFMVEIADLHAKVEDLSTIEWDEQGFKLDPEQETFVDVEDRRTCKAGHLADTYGYCLQLDCKFSRTYKAPKAKKEKK